MSTLLRVNPTMITTMLDGEAVIMDPLKGKVLALNEVGSFIWEQAKAKATMAELLEAICTEFVVSRSEASSDLEEFITILKAKELLLTD